MDRALDSDSESQGFDSLHAYDIDFQGLYQILGLIWFRHLKLNNI